MKIHPESDCLSFRNVFRFLRLVFIMTLILGCSDPMILMNDSERSLWRSQTGLPIKEASILQVKNLSRDLEFCSKHRNYHSLSEKQIQRLSMRKNRELYNSLIKTYPLCEGVIDLLFEKIELAHKTGNRRDNIYQAIVEGKADVTSSDVGELTE